ncbi:MAG: hypothetical protein OWR62_02970 [Sulfobacillus thermotolerans]|nr:hypothetical protein [Sulfobacillus thermotolerans]
MIVMPYRYAFIVYGAAAIMIVALLLPTRQELRSRYWRTRSQTTSKRVPSMVSKVALIGLVAWAALTGIADYNPHGQTTRIYGIFRGESSSQYFWNWNDPVSYKIGDTWVSFKHTTFNATLVGRVWLGNEGTATILKAYPVLGSPVPVITSFYQYPARNEK